MGFHCVVVLSASCDLGWEPVKREKRKKRKRGREKKEDILLRGGEEKKARRPSVSRSFSSVFCQF